MSFVHDRLIFDEAVQAPAEPFHKLQEIGLENTAVITVITIHVTESLSGIDTDQIRQIELSYSPLYNSEIRYISKSHTAVESQ